MKPKILPVQSVVNYKRGNQIDIRVVDSIKGNVFEKRIKPVLEDDILYFQTDPFWYNNEYVIMRLYEIKCDDILNAKRKSRL